MAASYLPASAHCYKQIADETWRFRIDVLKRLDSLNENHCKSIKIMREVIDSQNEEIEKLKGIIEKLNVDLEEAQKNDYRVHGKFAKKPKIVTRSQKPKVRNK